MVNHYFSITRFVISPDGVIPTRPSELSCSDPYFPTPYFFQRHHNDCSVAALKMALNYWHLPHSVEVDLNQLPRYGKHRRRHLFVGGSIEDAAEAIGLEGEFLVSSISSDRAWTVTCLTHHLKNNLGPMLCSVTLNRFFGHTLVLVGISENKKIAFIHDPAMGANQPIPCGALIECTRQFYTTKKSWANFEDS